MKIRLPKLQKEKKREKKRPSFSKKIFDVEPGVFPKRDPRDQDPYA